MSEEKWDDDLRDEVSQLPREIEPERDLWSGIAAEIRESVAGSSARGSSAAGSSAAGSSARGSSVPRIESNWRYWLLAAASLALVAVTGSFLRSEPPSVAKSPAVSAPSPDPSPEVLAEIRAAEDAYRLAAANLAATLERHRDALPAEVRTVVDDNLLVIDAAISDTRAALERAPGDTRVVLLLNDMYLRKLKLMQEAARLAATSNRNEG